MTEEGRKEEGREGRRERGQSKPSSFAINTELFTDDVVQCLGLAAK